MLARPLERVITLPQKPNGLAGTAPAHAAGSFHLKWFFENSILPSYLFKSPFVSHIGILSQYFSLTEMLQLTHSATEEKINLVSGISCQLPQLIFSCAASQQGGGAGRDKLSCT